MILVHSHLCTRPNTPLLSIYSRAAHGLGVGRLIISPVIVPRTSAGNFSAAATGMPSESSSDPIQQQLKVFSCLTIMLFAHTGKTTSLVDWIPTFKCHSIAVASRSINARCYETERASRSCRRSRSTLKLQRILRFGDIKEGVCTAINDLACSSCYQPAPIPAGLLDRVIPVAPANWISACPLTHPFNAFPQRSSPYKKPKNNAHSVRSYVFSFPR